MGANQTSLDDEAIPELSAAEVETLITTWHTLKKNIALLGRETLLIMFEKFPEEKRYFPFRDKSFPELKQSNTIDLHGLRIIKQLSHIMGNMNVPEKLEIMLNEHAEQHCTRNVLPSSYQHYKMSVLAWIKVRFNNDQIVVTAWRTALDIVFNLVTDYNKKYLLAKQTGHLPHIAKNQISKQATDLALDQMPTHSKYSPGHRASKSVREPYARQHTPRLSRTPSRTSSIGTVTSSRFFVTPSTSRPIEISSSKTNRASKTSKRSNSKRHADF